MKSEACDLTPLYCFLVIGKRTGLIANYRQGHKVLFVMPKTLGIFENGFVAYQDLNFLEFMFSTTLHPCLGFLG